VAALEPLAATSGGITPTHTMPVSAHPIAAPRKAVAIYVVAGALLLAAATGFVVWRRWAAAAARPLDDNLVAVLPFRTAGADPSVQYLRQGMVDLMQAKLTGEGGPRAADARSVLAAVRDAGGTETRDLTEEAAASVAKKLGAGRVLQGSIVGSADHLVMNASLVAIPGGKTVAQTSVVGTKDSIFTLIDRLTAQLLALGAGASSAQLSQLTTTNLDALRAYLDGVAAYRRGAFQNATPLLSRAVELDSTFGLALSWLVEADGWHPATTDMRRIRALAWQYRDRLNPQDQLFLSLRLGSRYPKQTPWTVRIADAEHAVQVMPESADAWYYLGDNLFHFGRISDIPEPEVRARQALEQAFQRDSLYGGPIQHLAALTWAARDTAAQRVWTRRLVALDSAGEGVPGARWNMLQATRDEAGIAAFLKGLDAGPAQTPQMIMFFGTLDSVTIAHRDALHNAAYRLSASKPDRMQTAGDRARFLMNLGRPAEAAKWIDTLATLDQRGAGLVSILGAFWFGGGPPDTTVMDAEQRATWRTWEGDTVEGKRLLATWRDLAAKDTVDGFAGRAYALLQARLAAERHDPSAARLLDIADSLWVGRDGGGTWAAAELAQLYERQGRVDRALRAIRRRWIPMGEPEPAGLAESYRLEGKLAALADDKVGATRAYRNYLQLRVDPEPSRVPQLDSVRAELSALGDLEKK
jgi:tetratricopeptide (TPR) repeat protein